jgi:hypothetical protein
MFCEDKYVLYGYIIRYYPHPLQNKHYVGSYIYIYTEYDVVTTLHIVYFLLSARRGDNTILSQGGKENTKYRKGQQLTPTCSLYIL